MASGDVQLTITKLSGQRIEVFAGSNETVEEERPRVAACLHVPENVKVELLCGSPASLDLA